ncbi:hypothetical protein [Planktothricoides raciborskii]|nr:hypothetical protein [Planktothricoides raciborskii]
MAIRPYCGIQKETRFLSPRVKPRNRVSIRDMCCGMQQNRRVC